MRPHGLLLAAAPFVWLACVSSSDVPDGGLDASLPDSATPPPGDGAPPPPRDAAGPDAPIADAAPDAPPAPASVTVIGATGPEPGAPIVWGSATGDVVATSATDATGTATQAIAGSGTTMVTAVLGTPAAPWVYTITGVEPGDRLIVLDRSSLARVSGLQAVRLTSVPTPPPTGSAALVLYVGSCNSTDQAAGVAVPMTIDLLLGQGQVPCVGLGAFGATVGAAFPALVESRDQTGNLLGFVASKDNGVAANDAGGIDVAVGGVWSASTTRQTVAQSGAPDAGAAYASWLTYSEVANGVPLPLAPRASADAGQPPGTALFATHVGYADFVQTEVGFNPSGALAQQVAFAMATRGPAPTADATTAIDATPLYALPSITNVTVDGSTLAQPKTAWTLAAGTLAASTGVIVRTSWATSTTDGAPPQTGDWTIVSAGSAQAAVQAPKLPAALGAYTPQAGAQLGPATVYAIQGATALPTYPLVRAASSAFFLQNGCMSRPIIPPLPLAGTLMVSGFTSGVCG